MLITIILSHSIQALDNSVTYISVSNHSRLFQGVCVLLSISSSKPATRELSRTLSPTMMLMSSRGELGLGKLTVCVRACVFVFDVLHISIYIAAVYLMLGVHNAAHTFFNHILHVIRDTLHIRPCE